MEHEELTAGRLAALTVFATAVLGSWILSADHPLWIQVGLLCLLPDLILTPCLALVLNACGFGKRAFGTLVILMVVLIPSFWVFSVVYAVTGGWFVSLAVAIAAAAILLVLTGRWAEHRRAIRTRQVSAAQAAHQRRSTVRSKSRVRPAG